MLGKFRGNFTSKIKKWISSGFYTIIVLMILGKYGSCYGYRIIKVIKDRSGNILSPSDSTIYSILHNLEKHGLVKAFWGEVEGGVPRRYYELTGEGRKVLGELLSYLDSFLRVLDDFRREFT